MAVTLIPDDLIQPNGELDAAMFPDGNIEDLIAGWLGQAASKVEAAAGIETTEQDAAAAAWVYYRAYSQIADRFASAVESITVGPRTERTSTGQQKYFADKARYWLTLYQGFEPVATSTPVMAFFGTVKARRYCGTRY